MKLSTGDIVELEVCVSPDKVSYMLNGLRYNSPEDLIEEFLSRQGLFTPRFDEWFGLKDEALIYDVNLVNRLFHDFRKPKYTIYFDWCNYYQGLNNFKPAEKNAPYPQKCLEFLCQTLEQLIQQPPQNQVCEIYS